MKLHGNGSGQKHWVKMLVQLHRLILHLKLQNPACGLLQLPRVVQLEPRGVLVRLVKLEGGMHVHLLGHFHLQQSIVHDMRVWKQLLVLP
jgi:hypothetical protein